MARISTYPLDTKVVGGDNEWKELLKMLLITITAAYFGGRSYEKGKSINK